MQQSIEVVIIFSLVWGESRVGGGGEEEEREGRCVSPDAAIPIIWIVKSNDKVNLY